MHRTSQGAHRCKTVHMAPTLPLLLSHQPIKVSLISARLPASHVYKYQHWIPATLFLQALTFVAVSYMCVAELRAKSPSHIEGLLHAVLGSHIDPCWLLAKT